MGLRHVDFTFLTPIKDRLEKASKETVVFIRPMWSKLHRVYSLPISRASEIKEVLNAMCTIRRYGVWYFRCPDEVTRAVISEPLTDFDLEPIFAEVDLEESN